MKTAKINLVISIVMLSSLGVSAPTQFLSPTTSEIQCKKDEDCLMVSSSCNDCCQQAAINNQSADNFNTRIKTCQQAWKTQKTPVVCDCAPQPAKAKCQNKKCSL